MGGEGAGASVIASQSRQENFSRTCSMIFQRRGSHSRVFEETAPRLCRRRPTPHARAVLVHPHTAALAAPARRRFNKTFDRQIVRQRTSRRPRVWRTLLLGGFW